MAYKNEVLIFIAGVACGFIGFWLVGILLTPNPSVSDNQPAVSADTPIPSSSSQGGHSTDRTATAGPTPESAPTPTRTELLAYQMALRSGSETESTQRFYRTMLPRVVRICDDMAGMSDVVNWLVRTHERILDIGVRDPDDLTDLSRNIYSMLVEMEPKLEGHTECEVLTRVYVELRMQGDSKATATSKMFKIIREH